MEAKGNWLQNHAEAFIDKQASVNSIKVDTTKETPPIKTIKNNSVVNGLY